MHSVQCAWEMWCLCTASACLQSLQNKHAFTMILRLYVPMDLSLSLSLALSLVAGNKTWQRSLLPRMHMTWPQHHCEPLLSRSVHYDCSERLNAAGAVEGEERGLWIFRCCSWLALSLASHASGRKRFHSRGWEKQGCEEYGWRKERAVGFVGPSRSGS